MNLSPVIFRAFPAAAFLAAALLPLSADAQLAGQPIRNFRLPVEYDSEGRPLQQVRGESATFLPDGIIQLSGLTIEIFSKGTLAATVSSPECTYAPAQKKAAGKESIRIVTEKGVVTGDGFAWNGENQQFQIFQNVRVFLDPNLQKSVIDPEVMEPIPDIDVSATEE